MRLFPLLALLLAAACAHQRPVVYPDDHVKSVGDHAVQNDVNVCTDAAKVYLKANPAKKVAGHAVRGGVFGAIMGVVFGAFTGDYGRAISEGAAVGAAGGAVGGAWEAGSPDQIQRAYTQRCLADKGYTVIGWK
jgi:uncharacterized protein YcfJ